MASHVFAASTFAANGQLRSSKLVKFVLEREERTLEFLKDEQTKLPRLIARRKTQLKTLLARTKAWENKKTAIASNESFFEELPKRIETAKANIKKLKKELEESIAREHHLEKARLDGAAVSPANRPTPAVKPTRPRGFWSDVRTSKTPTIRKETVMVPVKVLKRKADFPGDAKPNKRTRENTSPSLLSASARGAKRKRSDEPEQEEDRPAHRSRRLQKGKSDDKITEDNTAASSSDAQAESVKQASTSTMPPAAPACPSMASDLPDHEVPGSSGVDSTTASSTVAPSSGQKKGDTKQPIGRSTIDVNAKHVAKKRSPLRKSKEADAGTTSSGSSTEGSGKAGMSPLHGLINHNSACFSNVIIQLFDAALLGKDLDILLGKTGEIHRFGLNEQTAKAFDNTLRIGEINPKLKYRQQQLRDAIQMAAKAGKTVEVSAARHLRSVLGDLSVDNKDGASQEGSEYLFQSTVAWGASPDAKLTASSSAERQHLGGDTQEDCFEYYQHVLDILRDDPHIGNQEAFKDLFEMQMVPTQTCIRYGCGHKKELDTAASNYHDISVPEKSTDGTCKLSLHWAQSKQSRMEDSCPKCSKGSLTTIQNFTKEPENLVVKVNRAAFDDVSKTASKVTTVVEIDTHRVTLEGASYQLNAVVFHKGQTPVQGHYTIFRKQGDDWFHLDDKQCTKKSAAEVKDSARIGSSAMMLFKKVKD